MLSKFSKIIFSVCYSMVFVALFLVLGVGSAKADFASCGIVPEGPYWQIKDPSGDIIAQIDNNGNMELNSDSISENTTPSGSFFDTFLINDSLGTSVFSFSKEKIDISGKVYDLQTIFPDFSDESLVLKNSDNDIIALLEASQGANYGNIYLKGRVCYPIINITFCEELQAINNNLDGDYMLTQDIDCSGTIDWNDGAGFDPIGTFTGTFDGNNKTIQALYINRPTEDYIGLFGSIGHFGSKSEANIKNVGIVDNTIFGRNFVGGLVGFNGGATIENSYSTGAVSGESSVGGLVGFNNSGATINNSYSTGAVSGSGNSVGGLVGRNSEGSTVENSYSTGAVSGSGNSVGGVAGLNSGGTINNSYSTGAVSGGGNSVGGVAGLNSGGTINNSYSTGAVSGGISVGGLVGQNSGATIENSYSTGAVSGESSVGGVVGLNYSGATINNSYSTGTVSGSGNSVGGLVGRNNGATIENSYSTGAVSGGGNSVGGLVGWNYLSIINNSYWNTDTSGKANACGSGVCTGAVGKTIDEMVSELTYQTAWDFVGDSDPENIWTIEEGVTYPCHQWWLDAGVSNTCPKAPILINNCEELQAINNNLDGDYMLTQDIDCSDTINWNDGAGFIPIGTNVTNFTGTFDGKGYEIKNLYINRPNTNNVGLFGWTSGISSIIKNVGVVDNIIFGDRTVGGLIANNIGTTIENSYSTGAVSGGLLYVGGVVGNCHDSIIINSYSTGDVSGHNTVGGLVGWFGDSVIINSYSTGSVSGSGGSVGGLVGNSRYSSIINSYSIGDVSVSGDSMYTGGLIGDSRYSSITNSYSAGDVNGKKNVGGLAGRSSDSKIENSYSTGVVSGEEHVGGLAGVNDAYATIENSYSTGAVSGGGDYVGGLVGWNYTGSTINNSYWNTETSQLSNGCGSGDCIGATGKTTFEMITESTYQTAWDFVGDPDPENIWTIDEDVTYPCHQWWLDADVGNTCPMPVCVSDCAGKNCGDDGCGGLCGECSDSETCVAGACEPIFACGDNVNFVYNGLPVIYGTVSNPATGKCWLDRNLGATRVALSSTDSAAYGDLFQWGRPDDGHQGRISEATAIRSTADIPGHSNFITNSSYPNDWRNPQNTNLWQEISGINNPCPAGFRIPTETELINERISWGSNNSSGAFASPLKFTVAGYRYAGNGLFYSVGASARYWSSTLIGPLSRTLYFNVVSALSQDGYRADGASVRCIKD